MEDDLFGPPDSKPVVRLPIATNGIMNIAAVNQLHDELDKMKAALKEMSNKLEVERLASRVSQKEIEDNLEAVRRAYILGSTEIPHEDATKSSQGPQGLFGSSELVAACSGTSGISQPYYVEKEPGTDTNRLQTFQSIGAVKRNGREFCTEELRLADYFQGRRYAEVTIDKMFGIGPLLGFDYSFNPSKAPRGFETFGLASTKLLDAASAYPTPSLFSRFSQRTPFKPSPFERPATNAAVGSLFGSYSIYQDNIEKELAARTGELNKMLEVERQKSHAFEDKLKNSSLEEFLTQNAIAKGQLDSKVKENVDQGVRKMAEQLEQQKKDTERLLENQRRKTMTLDEALMSLSERQQVHDFVAQNQFVKSLVVANVKKRFEQQIEDSSQQFKGERKKLEHLLEEEKKRSKTLEDQLRNPTKKQLRDLLKQNSTMEDMLAADIKKKVEQEMGDMTQQLDDEKGKAMLALAAVEDMLKVAQTKIDMVEECMMKDPRMQVLQVWEKICTVTATPINLQDLTAPVESDSTGNTNEETYTDPLHTVDDNVMEPSGHEHCTSVSASFQSKSAFMLDGRALLSTPLPSFSKTPLWPTDLRIFGKSTEATVGFRQEPSLCCQSSEVAEGKRALVGGEENEPPAKRARDDNEE